MLQTCSHVTLISVLNLKFVAAHSMNRI